MSFSNEKMIKKAVIFDMDNCVIDTDASANKAFENAKKRLLENGVSKKNAEALEREYKKPMTFLRALETLKGKVPDHVLENAYEDYYANQDVSLASFTPGAEKVLKTLHGKNNKFGIETIAIITSGDHEQQERKLKQFGLRSMVNDVFITPRSDSKKITLSILQ
jgi:FMN phosphatase YigB (HAD superfamily)